ncbi:hypothetical protein P879_09317 [Paragonimus westermani]|uniref:Serine/threonine-protein phosphatase 2A activator n=1 Tax=Paragonimus westermani TaxID=34504 RepID=A0A8T0D0U3_9TREM|nr:hypothetical protein P879_09317 [Paragonimus westermani]
MVLTKRINSPQDLALWTVSAAYHDVDHFIQSVGQHVTCKPIRKEMPVSQAISSIVELLEELLKKIDSFPAEEQPQRFGNKAFRSWFNWLKENALRLCKSVLFGKNDVTVSALETIPFDEAVDEVAGYLVESFGNSTRIDYGTGHELAFIAFLVCLSKMGFLQPPTRGSSDGRVNDFVGVGLVVMPAYLRLVRRLQIYYRMEPAGSHGVWCLDDFHFVPYIWGCRQLIGHDQYGPSTISDQQIAAAEKDSYLLFSCIDYIYQVKTGPFAEHSNTLYGIGQVPSWEKVSSGLVKMYKGEVLNKFPVMQHFLFGKLLSFDPAPKPSLGEFKSDMFRKPSPVSPVTTHNG